MSVQMIHAVLKVAVFTPGSRGWGLPMLFWGEPGVGKSDIIEEFGRLYGMHVEVLSPGERGEGAFGVVPVVTGEGKSARISYPAPEWVDYFEDSDGGIVFVDEITTAPPALQPAMLGLLQARRIGGHKLDPRVRVVGAGNPPDIAASGYEISIPAANRMGHPDFGMPSVDEFRDWLLGYDPTKAKKKAPFSASKEEARVTAAWPVPFAKAKGLVSGFLHRRPDLLHKRPPSNDPGASRAWPSHRVWDATTRAIASCEIHGLDETQTDNVLTSIVGIGAMTELVSFRVNADLPDPVALLDRKTKWEHDADRLDRTMAVLSATTSVVCDPACANRDARVDALWEILANVSNGAEDIVISSMKPLIHAKLHLVKRALPVIAKMKSVLDAAGVQA